MFSPNEKQKNQRRQNVYWLSKSISFSYANNPNF